MKRKHLQLIPFAFAVSLLTVASCVNNDYDLTNDIDFTIQVGGSEFAIPGGSTEAIKLSKILKVEEGNLVDTLANGDYYLLQTGSPSNTNIHIDRVDIPIPDIKSIDRTLSFSYPSGISSTRANANKEIELVASIPTDEYKTQFKLSAELPKEIKTLSEIAVNIDASILFSFSKGITKKLNLKDISIRFPKNILSADLVDGVKRIQNQQVVEGSSFPLRFTIDGIALTPQNIVTTNGKSELVIEGDIVLNGEVSTLLSDVTIESPSISVGLTADIALNNIVVKSATGRVDPDINITVDPIKLNNLPDFLSDEEVRLDVTNPMIFFTANNQTPVGATIDGELSPFIKNSPSTEPIPFNITIAAQSNQKFCLSSLDPKMENIQWIRVERLPSLVTKIPDEIKIAINAKATNEEATVLINHDYSIGTDYSVRVPFVFGDKLSIVYKDSIDGWNENLSKYEIKQVNLTANVVNKLPLNLILSTNALKKGTNGQAEELKGVTVVVKVNNVANGIIKAGNLESGNTTPIVIEIKETIPGSVKQLDGLALRIVADSQNQVEGRLNTNQTLQLKDIKLKVPGGVQFNLNK